MKIQELADVVRQTGFESHVYFKNGYLEKVYENSLANRLRKKGLRVAQILSYLKTSGTKHGMLMNFGAPKFEVKKYIL